MIELRIIKYKTNQGTQTMKILRLITVSIAVILAASSMNVLASNAFDVKNQTAAGTHSFVIARQWIDKLRKRHTRLIQTINGLKSIKHKHERTHQRSIRRSNQQTG